MKMREGGKRWGKEVEKKAEGEMRREEEEVYRYRLEEDRHTAGRRR